MRSISNTCTLDEARYCSRLFRYKLFPKGCNISGDMRPALDLLNKELQKEDDPASRYNEWRQTVAEKRAEFPMWYPKRDDVIIPQWAVKARSSKPFCLYYTCIPVAWETIQKASFHALKW